MFTPMIVQYLVGLCCLRHDPGLGVKPCIAQSPALLTTSCDSTELCLL